MNFVSTPPDNNWSGENAKDSHGTAVAAICGGCEYTTTDNVNVPKGIAPNAGLFIFRVLQNDKLYNVDVALEYIIGLHNSVPIDVLCMSFRLPGKDERIEFLLSQLANAGVVCVAAAGNGGDNQDRIDFPASDPHVLSVGALRPLGQVSDLNPSDNIEVYAYGEDLVLPQLESQNTIGVQDGTSFAAPMVAGFLSLLIQCAKEVSPNVANKYHDVKLLKELFKNPILCDKRRLLSHRVPKFFSDILN
jgi:subtilisin family serine protease